MASTTGQYVIALEMGEGFCPVLAFATKADFQDFVELCKRSLEAEDEVELNPKLKLEIEKLLETANGA